MAEMGTQMPPGSRQVAKVPDPNAIIDLMESWDNTKDAPGSSGFCNWKKGGSIEGSRGGLPAIEFPGQSQTNIQKVQIMSYI